MTEEELKTKWCPFARVVRGDGVSGFNRGSDMLPDVGAMCIGSDCTAFRVDFQYRYAPLKPDLGPSGFELDDTVPPDKLSGHRYWRKPNCYCGLAGKP